MAVLPRIGLMLGDVTGIGPEIASKLLASGKVDACAQVIIIGDRRVLELGMDNAGVTVTTGLKTIFVTPAHGTAYDIVGSGSRNILTITDVSL